MSQIRVELELDDGSFTTRVLHAGESLKKLQDRVKGNIVALREVDEGAGKFIRTLGGLTVATGALVGAFALVRGMANGMLGDLVRVNAEFERMQQVMRGLSTSADPVAEARNQVRFLREEALQTPYSLRALTDVFVRLRATGVDPMAGSLRSLTDAVAAAGGTEEQLKRAALAISQMSGKGVIQMEELRQQLGEAIPRATELMARSMGVTYGELVQKISSGTVTAAPALDALRREFERTFGGSAQAQMRTLLGQFQQFQTRLQMFATNIGEAGLNDALRKQMQDLNSMMSGGMASAAAGSIGSGLTVIVNSIRRVIDTIIEMRAQIMGAAEVMLYAFGGALVVRSIGALTAGLVSLQTGVGTLRMHLASLGLVMTQVGGAASAASGGIMTKTAALMGAGTAAMFATRTLTALAGIMTILSPALMVVGAGLAVASMFWDVFGTGAKRAEEQMRSFGATSQKELDDFKARTEEMRKATSTWGTSRLDQARVELDAAMRRQGALEAMRTPSMRSENYRPAILQRADAAVEQRRKELADIEREIADREKFLAEKTKEFQEREAERKAAAMVRESDEFQRSQSLRYDREGVAAAEAQNRRLAEAMKAERSTASITKEYQEASRQRAIAYYEEQATYYEKRMIDAQRIIAESQDDIEKAAAQRAIQTYDARALEARRKLAAERQAALGIMTTAQPLDEEEMKKKARNMISELQARSAGLRAEMMGASSEAAKLAIQMNEIRFKGGNDNPEIARLIQNIIEAQVQFDKLEKMMAAQRRLTSDIESAIRRSQDRIIDLQTEGANEYVKILARVREGLYEGVSIGADGNLNFDTTKEAARQLQEELAKPEGERRVRATNEALARVQALMTGANNTAKSLQETLQNGAFGQQTQNSVNTFNSTLEQSINLMERMRTLGQNPFQVVGAGTMASPGFEGGGWSSGGNFGKFIDRLIGVESSGVANAQNPNSSARGLGQFISSTWLQFMKEMKPGEFGVMSRQQMLALRDNPAYSREATEWYARKNAANLEGAGFRPTDANLYLSHFLGPEGALRALRANGNASTRSVLGDDAVNANRRVLDNKTIGEVIAGIRMRFGDAVSIYGQAGSAARPFQGSPEDGVRATQEQAAAQQAVATATSHAATAQNRLNTLREQMKKEGDAELAAGIRQYGEEARKAAERVEGLGKNEAEVRRQIAAGKYAERTLNPTTGRPEIADQSQLDFNNPRFRELLDAARRADEAAKKQEEANQRRQRAEQAARDIERMSRDRQRQSEDTRRRLADPLGRDPAQDVNLRVRRQAEENLQRIKELHGEESEEYRRQAAEVARIRAESSNEEASKRVAELARQNQQTRAGLMTETQGARAAAEERIRVLQKELQETQATGDARVALEKQINDAILLERQKLAANGPMAQSMRQWMDMGRNMEQAMVGWIDGAIDALGDFVTKGKLDFSKLANSIIKDMMKIGMRAMIAQKKGSAASVGGAGKGGAAKGGGAKLGLRMFGAAHTGGVIGALSMSRGVSPAAFIGAPRFHTGGMIRGLGLAPGEVPIIAKQGEGVFTPAQMRAMGSRSFRNQMTYAPQVSVSVNASGGKPEQNQDLAERTAREVENSIRAIAADEMRKSMRPGGMAEAYNR